MFEGDFSRRHATWNSFNDTRASTLLQQLFTLSATSESNGPDYVRFDRIGALHAGWMMALKRLWRHHAHISLNYLQSNIDLNLVIAISASELND